MGSRHPTKMHIHKDEPLVLEHPDAPRVETLCGNWCVKAKVVSRQHFTLWTVELGYTSEPFCNPCQEEGAAL